mgnify:CR=1 FL=1|jgi:hypothetical protein
MNIMATAGKSTPHIPDEIDKFYLNPVWTANLAANRTTSVVGPFKAGVEDPGGGPVDPPGTKDERPQIDDIQRPVTQEIYYVNNIARVKVKMRIYISSTDAVKKFKITSTLPVSRGGRT